MTETPPARDDERAGDPWFRPMPPEEHAERHGVPEPPLEPGSPAPEPAPVPPPAVPPRTRRESAHALTGEAIAVGIVLALFAIAAIVIPTMAPVATPGDWRSIRSVEILLDEGRLTVIPADAATAIGQVAWGALFGAMFGMSPGVMRVSTLVMVALGAIALYAILRQVGVSRSRGALGMAVWLFNPLTFSLAFSFMTDAHFVSAMLIAVALSLRGLQPDREDWRWVAAGSIAAAFAFLIRQQGALVPLAIAMYLLASGRPWLRRDLRRLVAIVAVPAATVLAWVVWQRWLNDAPGARWDDLDDARWAGWERTWLLVRRIPGYATFYAGLLLVPVLAAIAPWRRRTSRPVSGFMVYLGVGWVAFILATLYRAGLRDQHMPFVPQVVGLEGLGLFDVPGGRPILVPDAGWATTALTVVAALGAVGLGLVAIRALGGPRDSYRAGFWLAATVGFWQLIGIVVLSGREIDRGVTLDRYLLPLFPIAIVVALWALRDVDLMPAVGWILVAAVAVVSVAGTRDALVRLDHAWSMADYARDHGVEDGWLDAGAAWKGYHLPGDTLDEMSSEPRQGSPWWHPGSMDPSGASYVVATRPDARTGYVVAASDEFDLWLDGDPGTVYLLRRWYQPFPVTVAPVAGPGPAAVSAPPAASPVPATPVATPASAEEAP